MLRLSNFPVFFCPSDTRANKIHTFEKLRPGTSRSYDLLKSAQTNGPSANDTNAKICRAEILLTIDVP